ncbi:MAG TPA: hypothetical protein VMG38_23540 [Trebonia sp.]|nr:hypothetical protein [Trebonia sp.]
MGPILLALPDGSSGDQFRSLRDWLGHDSEMRGRIGLVEGEPVPGTLASGVVEALTVGAGSGGAISVLVSGIVSWLRQLARQRRHEVPAEVTLKFADGSTVTIVTAVAQAWTLAELGEQIDHLAELAAARVRAADDAAARPTASDAG